MASKTITVSLSEAIEWKLTQLEKHTSISRSKLIRKALLLLFAEMESYAFPGGQFGEDETEQDIEEAYKASQQV